MNRIVGVDIGTMFMVGANRSSDNNSDIEFSTMRNMFYPITDEDVLESELDSVRIKSEDGMSNEIYAISDGAYRFCNAFNVEVQRPMKNGVVSPTEIDAVEILAAMLSKMIGKTTNGYCVYSVPEKPIDKAESTVIYHEKVFGKIFESLGYTSEPLNEAMAIIYSECKKEEMFSGIAISFGSGLTNVACSFRGKPIIAFSVNRGGDWIDKETAISTASVVNKVTSIKEKDTFNLLNPLTGIKSVGKMFKKEKQIRESLTHYYKNIIEYVLNLIVKKFETVDFVIENDIPIIISGGTSKPTGFVDIFSDIFNNYTNFPYPISEIRHASDPLKAVATGCLIKAELNQKKKGN